MGIGIGASLTSFSSGTTISSSSVNSNFSSLNSNGVSNDSGSISTSGGGVITATGFTIGSSEHITLGGSSTIRFNSADVLYVETGPGHTDIQLYGSGGQIRFKDQSGNTVAAVNLANRSFALADSGQNLHDVVYNSNSDLCLQMINNNNKVYFKDANGNNIASLDSAGNWKTKGSQTVNTTP